MISICSQQCHYSMKYQRFYCFISFVENADIHMSGNRRNSTIGPRWEINYLYNGQLSTSRCIKTVLMFQEQVVFNIKINGSVQLFQKMDNIIKSSTTRSDKHSCGKPMLTDHDKATGRREPADETNEEDPMQGTLVWLQPFTVNLEDLEAQCSHIPLKERTQIRKVVT